jgi:hypothetical protein
MATTQLSLYNEALLLVGERELTTVSDAVEARYRLDTAYANGVDYCLELVAPVFARKTSKLTTYTTSSVHAYDNVFTLPADYISMVELYSDEKLDQPISRYIIEGGTLACNYTTIYLRYITNSYALTLWDRSFVQVVVAYLAMSVAPRIASDEVERITALFNERVNQAVALRQSKEPDKRSSNEGVTLTNDWRAIYNNALMILGLDEINSNTDDSDRKVKLDVARSSNLIEYLLEKTGWHWAIQSYQAQYNPSLEPEWGYNRVFDKPDDLHRLDGIFEDEMMQTPLKTYKDEGEYIYTNINTIYIQFVSNGYLTTPSYWPSYFRRLVAAAMARDVAMSLGVDPRIPATLYEEIEYEAKNIDIMQSPPRKISTGSWVRARYSGYPYRGRP